MAASPPAIETTRVVLRPHRPEDFDAYTVMWADPIVTRYVGGRPRSREESWIRFLRQFGMWPLLGFGFWALEDKATGRFIGEAGFHDLKRDMVPSIEGIPEAAWALIPAVHGKGLATEIVRRITAWGDDNLGAEKTVCIIDASHAGSIAVAEKCGYAELLRTTYHGAATILFKRPMPPRA
jgi:RimJ/RimL family protein N-acetyltransferase